MRGACFVIGFLALLAIPETANGMKLYGFITLPIAIALMAFAGGFNKSIRKLKERRGSKYP